MSSLEGEVIVPELGVSLVAIGKVCSTWKVRELHEAEIPQNLLRLMSTLQYGHERHSS